MNIHEFQAKMLLHAYGIPVAEGEVAQTIHGALEASKKLLNHNQVVAIKAQIHAGGRGKGGGIKIARSSDEAACIASNMLGHRLITPQTGPEGKIVRKLYIEAGAEISREIYLSLILDRQNACISIIASAQGGMDIEEVAHTNPDKIKLVKIDPLLGLMNFHIKNLSNSLDIPAQDFAKFKDLLCKLYLLFTEKHLMQLEINPLVLTADGTYLPLDAKMTFDDNALAKLPDIAALDDADDTDPLEARAKKSDLSYIKMEGDIGCMVNGAGLAMATMDIISLYGGRAANFLDVGGGATAEKVAEGFRIITSDPGVKVIFVNIFGGIMRCDIIAEGIIAAAKQLQLSLPVVIRLDGNNAELGREMLKHVAGLHSLHTAHDLDEAAQLAVSLYKQTAQQNTK